MTRRDEDRLRDILAAIGAIQAHLRRGDLRDGLVFDAVRVRLIEIGEAAKALSGDVADREADVPWTQIAGMRDRLAHRYFDTSHAILQATVEQDLPELEAVTRRLLDQLTGQPHAATANTDNEAVVSGEPDDSSEHVDPSEQDPR